MTAIEQKQEELIEMWRFYANDISAQDYAKIKRLESELAALKEQSKPSEEVKEDMVCHLLTNSFHYTMSIDKHSQKKCCDSCRYCKTSPLRGISGECDLCINYDKWESKVQPSVSAEEIPVILDEFEKNELGALRKMQADANVFMSNERQDRLKELAKREFGFDMGYTNPYGNLFRTKDGQVVQGGLNASKCIHPYQKKENSLRTRMKFLNLNDMKELFEKIYIKSAKDLPKEKEFYVFGFNNGVVMGMNYGAGDKYDILKTADWYLQPIAPVNLRDEDMVERWIETEMPINTDDAMDEEINKWCRKAVRLFAQAMRDNLITPKNE